MRPAMSVPKSFGTGGAPAARHIPCLAKTTHFLHVISLVAAPQWDKGAAEPHILAGVWWSAQAQIHQSDVFFCFSGDIQAENAEIT